MAALQHTSGGCQGGQADKEVSEEKEQAHSDQSVKKQADERKANLEKAHELKAVKHKVFVEKAFIDKALEEKAAKEKVDKALESKATKVQDCEANDKEDFEKFVKNEADVFKAAEEQAVLWKAYEVNKGVSAKVKIKEGEGIVAAHARLVRELFHLCDRDGDGRLSSCELRTFAELCGYEGTPQDWVAEFAILCAMYEVGPGFGICLSDFEQLTDDESDDEQYCTDVQIEYMIQQLVMDSRRGFLRFDPGGQAQGCCC